MLTGDGPRVLTNCLSGEGEENEQQNNYKALLMALGKIVRKMGAPKFLSEEEMNELEIDCHNFGRLYLQLADKDDTVTPKMHTIVKHVPEFMRRFGTVGLISEHGLESMHARLNKIAQRYACLRSMPRKLRYMLKEQQTASTRLHKKD